MGIRFYCPNGHPLNVKAFLAGKKAKCPKCGAKVQVPASSVVPSERASIRGSRNAGRSETREASDTSEPRLPSYPTTIPEPTAVDRTGTGSFAADWYLQHPEGGRYGPVSESVFNQWIEEGRVPEDAWVWRTSWEQWRRAGPLIMPGADSGVDLDGPAGELEQSPAVRGVSRAGRRRVNPYRDYAVPAIVILSLASVLLLIVLLVILNKA
jgi:hypothetical protein